MNENPYIFTWTGIGVIALIAILISLTGCASTYNACKDPKSYIVFLPEQCHAYFNREDA